MTGTDGIDIVAFKAGNIPFHVFQGNTPSGSCIPLMAVHSTDHQPLAVQFHHSIRRIQNKIPEADLIRHHFRHFTLTVCQRDLQLIQIRILMTPGCYFLCQFFLKMQSLLRLGL